MNDSPENLNIEERIVQARKDPAALGNLFEIYRPYLEILASRHLERASLRSKIGAADMVQETFQRAGQAFSQFTGTDEPTFSVWLKNILRNRVTDVIRCYYGPKRNVRVEEPLYDVADSATLIVREVADDQTSPSMRAIKGETALLLAQALKELPPTQSDAVHMRYLDQLTLKQIAQQLGRTEGATAGLIKRGMKTLRESVPKILREYFE